MRIFYEDILNKFFQQDKGLQSIIMKILSCWKDFSYYWVGLIKIFLVLYIIFLNKRKRFPIHLHENNPQEILKLKDILPVWNKDITAILVTFLIPFVHNMGITSLITFIIIFAKLLLLTLSISILMEQ